MKIKKGDTIKILSGKDRGKTGKVVRADSKTDRIVVEGLNVYKKRVRPRRGGQKGETVLISKPFPVSKAMLICASCHKATRIGSRLEEEQKVRYCKKCHARQ